MVKQKEDEISDEEYYNLMVEGYSEMANEPTIDQEIDAIYSRYISKIKTSNETLRDALLAVQKMAFTSLHQDAIQQLNEIEIYITKVLDSVILDENRSELK